MQNTDDILQLARDVLDTEAKAILNLRDKLGAEFLKACQILLACEGRIIITGVGKSGHIGNKIAATLSSTGSPAFFIHPGDASHGDIGAITKKDVIIALSHSGKTEEILSILPIIKLLGVPLISITGNPDSILAKTSDIHICTDIQKEACPLGLAPTTSTTVTLALGDALAIALIQLRGFTVEDFARSHPGGALGKRLLLRVEDLMRTGNLIPIIKETSLLSEAIVEMSSKRMGMTTVVNENNILSGIFTDGDLRRIVDKNIDIHTTPISAVMTKNCKTIPSETLAIEAVKIMEKYQVMALVITNEANIPIGAISMHDLLKSGLV